MKLQEAKAEKCLLTRSASFESASPFCECIYISVDGHVLVCMLAVLTIVGIVEINYFAPAIKLYCINDGLMIIRAHAEGKVEEARRWRKHLKRENYGKQPQIGWWSEQEEEDEQCGG